MKSGNYKLYDAFGELLYVLCMADGEIQVEEVDSLQQLLRAHPWSKEIEWSFNYEAGKENALEDVYKKVLFACFDLGPNPEYEFMIEVLESVAASSLGITEEENRVIQDFRKDLTDHFGENS